MNTDLHSLTTPKVVKPIQVDLDEFDISEDTFKPMTKGLGFHQDTKKQSFKPAPKETKTFAGPKFPVSSTLAKVNANQIEAKNGLRSSYSPVSANAGTVATGLEAFYGKSPTAPTEQAKLSSLVDEKIDQLIKQDQAFKTPSSLTQFTAWIIDLMVIISFVALTGALLVFASGIEIKMYSRLINNQELLIFGSAIFSIYYIMYFTILDLGASPGKTIMGLRLVRTDKGELAVKHTITRALVSLLSGVALFLPMLLDFQGRLSDTKVVK
jgi:uncharacterized RDD family membrane protein YckC